MVSACVPTTQGEPVQCAGEHNWHCCKVQKPSLLPTCKRGSSGVFLLHGAQHRYTNTTAVISRISFIDGDKGILRYRGYPIEELAERGNFLETAYLVLFGDLPTQGQLSTFEVRGI